MLPDGRGWLLVEFGGETKEEADEKARALMRDAREATAAADGDEALRRPTGEQHVWEVREAGLGATAFIPGKPDTYEGWEDSAVPPERLGEYLRELAKLAERYGYESALYGHYGQGCVHARWNFDLVTTRGHREVPALPRRGGRPRALSSAARSRASTATASRAPSCCRRCSATELVEAFREFKSIWDPDWKMNPGKVVDPYPIDDEPPARHRLRAADGRRRSSPTRDDGGSFAHATDALRRRRRVPPHRRRRRDVPELHGHARGEALDPRPRAAALRDAERRASSSCWRSTEVLEALDLCLSCKGCTTTARSTSTCRRYKAEFLSHHYKRRLRPRARVRVRADRPGGRASPRSRPGSSTSSRRRRAFARLAKAAAGIAPEREIPRVRAARRSSDVVRARGAAARRRAAA